MLLLRAGAVAQEAQESKLQAAMLFNILKYIEWPGDGEGDKFVVGVLGGGDVYEALKASYEGKPKGAKKCTILKVTSVGDVGSCSVVFIGKDKSKEFDPVKNALNGKNVLTVTDKDDLGRRGSCINFVMVDGKLRFELNKSMISAYNLKVSGALMSIAILI
jgi:hypothetical protein